MGTDVINEVDGERFRVARQWFRVVSTNYAAHKTTASEIVILKGPGFLRQYDPIFESAPAGHVLEFGIFEGGSILYFAHAFPERKFVGVDIRPPNDEVLRHVHDL